MRQISLAAARVNAGKTQAHLAQAVGVSKNLIIDWEKDRKPIPQDKFEKYCKTCGCTPSDVRARVISVIRT